MNISNWITKNARFSPNKVALYFEEQQFTYSALSAEVARVATILSTQFGIQKGDRIGLLSNNRPEYLTLLFACARLGAILNPINWRLALPEWLFIGKDANWKLLFVESGFAEVERPLLKSLPTCQLIGLNYAPEHGTAWQQVTSDSRDGVGNYGRLSDPLLLVYTSGTTGHPKGALLTQDNIQWNVFNAIHMMDLTQEDHVLTVLPLFHVGGLNNQTTPTLYAGGTVTLHSKFDPMATLEAIDSGAPTATCLVPATMAACIQTPLWHTTNFSNLRLNVTGSTLVPTQLSNQFRAKGIAVLEMYGLTETAPVSVYHRLNSDFEKLGSTGLAGLHTEVRVVDLDHNDCPPHELGEILIKGANVMQAYWQNPKATADSFTDGWFHTGDIGFLDAEGYLFIKDRKKNMIISGSENIYSAEVERVLYEHPAILECALIGRPDKKWGEIPVAVVVLKEEEVVDEAMLRKFINGRLARYKQPKQYIFTDTLPKSALGKIQHYLIREQFV